MIKKLYVAPASKETATAMSQLIMQSITNTGGADGLGTGDDEGTGEAGIDFGNAKERPVDFFEDQFEPEDSLW